MVVHDSVTNFNRDDGDFLHSLSNEAVLDKGYLRLAKDDTIMIMQLFLNLDVQKRGLRVSEFMHCMMIEPFNRVRDQDKGPSRTSWCVTELGARC